jgi:hypothetical protein
LKRQYEPGIADEDAGSEAPRPSACISEGTSRTVGENPMKNQSVSLSAAALQVAGDDGWLRAAALARAPRIRILLLLALIHIGLGLTGRSIGLFGGPGLADAQALRLVLQGIAVDGGQVARILLPAAALLVLLPARWYQSFALWMLIGLASLASITLSVAFAIERARGAVALSASELLGTATSAGSLWMEHPITAALMIASLTAILLLGPVRRAARCSVEAASRRDP